MLSIWQWCHNGLTERWWRMPLLPQGLPRCFALLHDLGSMSAARVTRSSLRGCLLVMNFYWFDLLIAAEHFGSNFVGMWGIIFLVSLRLLPLIAAETASQAKTWPAGQLVDQTFTDRHLENSFLEIQQLMVCASLVPWAIWKQPRQNWCITRLAKSIRRFRFYIFLCVNLGWGGDIQFVLVVCIGWVWELSTICSWQGLPTTLQQATGEWTLRPHRLSRVRWCRSGGPVVFWWVRWGEP